MQFTCQAKKNKLSKDLNCILLSHYHIITACRKAPDAGNCSGSCVSVPDNYKSASRLREIGIRNGYATNLLILLQTSGVLV